LATRFRPITHLAALALSLNRENSSRTRLQREPGKSFISARLIEGAVVNFELYKPSNDSLGFGRGGCGDLGPVTLPTAGIYKILVKADRAAASYSFSLRPTAFEQYSIKIGDAVSPDYPARGAGVIAQLGEQQSYSFIARAGQVIYFRASNCQGPTVFFDVFKTRQAAGLRVQPAAERLARSRCPLPEPTKFW
jgi:hypothetical protein